MTYYWTPGTKELNFNKDKCHSFHKHNDETTQIHVESDHPPQFIKNIARWIEKKLVQLYSTKEIIESSMSSI